MDWKLIRIFAAALGAFLLPGKSSSQVVGSTCGYEEQVGVEFQFDPDESLARSVWIQNFSPYKDFSDVVDPSKLAGTRAKITRHTTGAEHGRVLEVLRENCEVLFVRNDGRILPRHEAALGVRFLTDVSKGWQFRVATSGHAPSNREDDHWTAREKVDPMTDARSCAVISTSTPTGLKPLFFYHSQEGFSVGLIGADFPGREVGFRVDKNRAITGVDALTSAQSQALVAQIRAGGSILTVSGRKWPYDYPEYDELLLQGLTQKLDYCRDAVK